MKIISLCVLLFGLFALSIAQPTTCDDATSCTQCKQRDGCGWCTPIAKCMEGSKSGPNGTLPCLGNAWQYGTCTDCGVFKDCRSCETYDTDCNWCPSDGTCHSIRIGDPCKPAKFCPCEDLTACTDCVNDPYCQWCEVQQTCNLLNVSCTGPSYNGTGSCACSAFTDCKTCRENSGCSWCESGTPRCIQTGSDPTCTIATSCELYCNTVGASGCDVCITEPGCAWCGDQKKCVDSANPTCLIRHTCPNCDHKYCDPCIDEPGCTWCSDTSTCQLTPANCLAAHTCESYCQGYPTCDSCNRIPGCGWCDGGSVCVDIDRSTCAVSHMCGSTPIPPAPQCGFDGGAFVGGMFLVIGLIVLAVLAYIFYRWKTGKKLLYTELR